MTEVTNSPAADTPYVIPGRRSSSPRFSKHAPDFYAGLAAAGAAVAASGLEPALLELVKIRASQINGCAFCVQMHVTEARTAGESEDRLQLLAVWEEAPVFTARERAALAWTEAVTRLSQHAVSDALYAEVTSLFSEAEVSHLAAAVALINAYNRLGAPLRFPPAVKARA